MCGFHLAGIPCYPQTFCVVQLKYHTPPAEGMGGGGVRLKNVKLNLNFLRGGVGGRS